MMIINDMHALHQASESSQQPTPYVDWAPARKTTAHKIVGMSPRSGDPGNKSPQPRVLLLGSGFIAQAMVIYSCYSGNNAVPIATNDLYQGKRF